MSNANVEFKLEHDPTLGADVLRVIAENIPEYQKTSRVKVDDKLFASIIQDTINDTNRSVTISTKVSVKTPKAPAPGSILLRGTTTASVEANISDEFVNRLIQITRSPLAPAVLKRDILARFETKLQTALRGTPNITVQDKSDYSPDTMLTTDELFPLKTIVDANVLRPTFSYLQFKHALQGAPTAAGLLPGFTIDRATATPPTPEARLRDNFTNPDATIKLFDQRLSEFLEMTLFKLSQLKTAGTIDEATFYKNIAELTILLSDFRKKFVADTKYSDYKAEEPLKDANEGVRKIFTAITTGSDQTVKDLLDIFTISNPTRSQIKQFRDLVVNKSALPDQNIDVNVTTKAWATPINLGKVKEAVESVSTRPIVGITTIRSEYDQMVTDNKIGQVAMQTIRMLQAEIPASITDPLQRKFELIKKTREYIKELRGAATTNSQFEDKLEETLNHEILYNISPLGTFEDRINPLSHKFDIRTFGANFHGGRREYQIFQSVLQRLNEYSKNSDPEVKEYFTDLNKKLREKISEATGPIQIRLNELQVIKNGGRATPITPSEETELRGLIDVKNMTEAVDSRVSPNVGLDAQRDFTQRELASTINEFAKEFKNVSVEREKELRNEIRQTDKNLRSATRAGAQNVITDLNTKKAQLEGQMTEVKAVPDNISEILKNAKNIVSGLYNAQANIEKSKEHYEKASKRAERRDKLRNKFFERSRVALAGAVTTGVAAAFGPVDPAGKVLLGAFGGYGLFEGIDALTGGNAKRYAREKLMAENAATIKDIQIEAENAVDSQEALVEDNINKLTLLARTFKQYKNNKGRFTTEDKYRYLRDSWGLYFSPTGTNAKLEEVVQSTGEVLSNTYSNYNSKMKESNIGLGRGQKERVQQLKQEYRDNHAARTRRFNARTSGSSAAGTTTGSKWGILGRLRNIFGN